MPKPMTRHIYLRLQTAHASFQTNTKTLNKFWLQQGSRIHSLALGTN